MNKKATIIVSASVSVSVITVAILILFLTGVISVGGKNVNAYDYLCENGTFNSSNEISEIGSNYTHYEWKSADGFYRVVRNDFYNEWGTDIYYHFSSKNCYGVCNIGDTSFNTYDRDKEAYTEFLDWCDDIGYNPNQIMDAIDKYAESRK